MNNGLKEFSSKILDHSNYNRNEDRFVSEEMAKCVHSVTHDINFELCSLAAGVSEHFAEFVSLCVYAQKPRVRRIYNTGSRTFRKVGCVKSCNCSASSTAAIISIIMYSISCCTALHSYIRFKINVTKFTSAFGITSKQGSFFGLRSLSGCARCILS